MPLRPITATAVDSMKRAAKRRARTGTHTYSQALEQEAVEAGYENWHAVTLEQKAASSPTAGAALTSLPLDPVLPRDFYNTANEERSTEELALWWERPYACTNDDGTLDVRCLDGGAWDRPIFYGTAANMAEACALANRKLNRWRTLQQQPVFMMRDHTLAWALISPHPHREPTILAEFPKGEQAAANAWMETWQKEHPNG
jgi:hypothetical protein